MTEPTLEELQKKLDEAKAKEKRKQADQLIDIALAGAVLFHAPDSTCFADLSVLDHRETWPVRSKGFRRWLSRQYFEQTKGAPVSEAMQSALNVLEAKGHFDGEELPVHVRIGDLGGKVYIDLADSSWSAIEVDVDGWRIVDEPPVRFRRSAGMQALERPTPGGKIGTLRGFLNLADGTDFVLVVAAPRRAQSSRTVSRPRARRRAGIGQIHAVCDHQAPD